MVKLIEQANKGECTIRLVSNQIIINHKKNEL